MNKLLKISVTCLAVTILFSAAGFAQEVPGAKQQEPIVLKNATLHPINAEQIKNGMLLIEDGKIAAIGKKVDVPEGAKIVDL